MAKDEQDVRVDREVEVLQRFLKKQHQEALAGVVSQLAEVTAALQAEQSKYQAMEKDDSDFRKKAQGAIKDWKTAYVALQG